MRTFLTIAIVLVAASGSINADVPQRINYQGHLTEASGTPVPDAAYLAKFVIYDDPTATAPANEKWNSGFQTVNTVNGLFHYDLGSNTPYLPDDLFTDTLSWLGITIGTNPEMSPRIGLTSKGYAYHALRADSANTLGGQVPSYYLAWSNLTGVPAGFADGIDDDAGGDITAVTAGTGLTGGGSAGSVTLDVDPTNLQLRVTGVAGPGQAIREINSDGSIVPTIVGDITGVTTGPSLFGGDSIGNVYLEVNYNGILSSHIGTGAVRSSEVQDNSLLAVDLAENSVEASEIAVGAVGTSEVADNSLTANDLAAGAVRASEIATGAVGSEEILDRAIVSGDISNSANIAIHKIEGTAVNLSSTQTISGDKTFEPGTTTFGDSAMVIENNSIRIGDGGSPLNHYMVAMHREYSTNVDKIGLWQTVNNTSFAPVYGTYIDVGSTEEGDGRRVGLYSKVNNELTSSESIYAVDARAGNVGKIAGTAYGVYAKTYGGSGSLGYGIYAVGGGTLHYAGWFAGRVHVGGNLSKSGGSFKIDHPLDPANKYLQHSFVESPDMMNIYNGNVVLDANGRATVTMPDWFDVLNMEFRYQLTPIGGPGPNLYIASEMQGNSFEIAGGEARMKVSWQVTGIRNDRYAQAHRIQVEIDKPTHELGTYLNPEEHGQPIERYVHWEQINEEREHDADMEAMDRDGD